MKKYFLNEDAFMKDLKGLMQIKTVNRNCGKMDEKTPLGEGVYNAIQYLLDLGKSFGFKTKMLDGYCGWIEIGEGDRMIAVLGHVDVVPVDSEGWISDPFDANLIDGKVYGRGICDDKGPTLLTLYAMKALVDNNVKLDKRIRLIIGGDEESGAWECMKRYRETEEIPECAFSPDGDYPATYAEKGIIHVTISRDLDLENVLTLEGGSAYNIVPSKATATYNGKTYEAEGKAAHASRPELGVNATIELCKKLKAEGVDHPFVDLMLIATKEGFNIDMEDAPSGKLTLNPAIAHVDKDTAYVKCDIRMPVTVKKEDVVTNIQNAVAKYGFKAEDDFLLDSLYVKADSKLVTTLQDIYKEYTGRNDEPIAVGGGTYARTFDNAVAFGPLLPGEENTNHKTNECWDYNNMMLTYQIIAACIERL